MKSRKRVMIVAAHPDDEILGCGGTLIKHRENGDEIFILWLADGESSRGKQKNIRKRNQQAKTVARQLKTKGAKFGKFPDNEFDKVSLLRIARLVEAVVRMWKPNVIYTHHEGDLNVDHRLTYRAVITACRPGMFPSVEEIMTFEVLSSSQWQPETAENVFLPNVFVNIEKFIREKIKLVNIYEDELRAFPHPRSIQGIKVLAKYRGMQGDMRYAEAFKGIRHLKK